MKQLSTNQHDTIIRHIHWFTVVTASFTAAFSLIVVAHAITGGVSIANAQAVVNYYVDGTNGNDSNDGLTQQTAWKTLTKANTSHIACSTVNILPGEYHESIFPKAGTSGCRTVYQGLGNRSEIKIIGSDPITSWSQYSGQVYLASFRNNASPRCDSGIRDTDCWEDRARWLTSVDSIGEVNGPGKYFYSYTDGQVYVWTSDGQAPSHHTIECSARKTAPLYSLQTADQPAGYSGSPSYITIQNLTVMHGYDDGISFGGHDVTINNNEFAFNSGGGSCAANPSGIIHLKTSQIAHNIVVTNNLVHDQGSDEGPATLRSILGHHGSGIELYSVEGALVENNVLYNVDEALYVKSGYDPVCYQDVVIRNNIVHSAAAGAIFYNGGSGNTSSGVVYGNLFYDINGYGVVTLHDNSGVGVYNNTLWDTHGIARELFGSPGDNFTVKNNIVADVPAYSDPIGNVTLWFGTSATTASDYNVFRTTHNLFGITDVDGRWQGTASQNLSTLSQWRTSTGFDAHSQEADPKFVNSASADFTLQSSSPAIDAGVIISGVHCAQSDDVNPNQTNCRHWKGGAPDIGAFESGVTVLDITPPARTTNLSAQ